MDLILILGWFLISFIFLCGLISGAYYAFIRGTPGALLLARVILAGAVYGLLTCGTGFLAGMLLFLGAHSEPKDSILDIREILVGAVILIAFAIAGWLTTSFLVGRLIRPGWFRSS